MKKLILLVFVFLISIIFYSPVFAKDSTDQAKELGNAFTKVGQDVGKSVVAISTITIHSIGNIYFYDPYRQRIDPFFEEFFKNFFDSRFKGQYKQQGLGSGVIIDKEGHILTNEHVINSADEISVTLADGREFKAKLKGADLKSDIAILKIDPKEQDLPIAILGDSDKVKVGEWSIAIGNPFGFIVGNTQPTLTVGVISALHRNIDMGQILEGRYYGNLIQTDAAINPGNSGGPLVNIQGEIIGLNTLIFSRSGGYQGLGFAIPINRIKNVLNDLIEGNKILYGWLGIWIQPITEEMMEAFGLNDRGGALIFQIEPNSPSDKAGLKTGDVIIELDNQKIFSTQDVIQQINKHRAGTTIPIAFIRNNRIIKTQITIAVRPEQENIVKIKTKTSGQKQWRGLTLGDISEELQQKFSISTPSGVVIENIDSSSETYKLNLSIGTIIYEVNRQTVNSLEQFQEAVKNIKGNILLRTNRGYITMPEDK